MNELPYMPCSTLKDELDLAVQEERYEDAAYLHELIEAGVRPTGEKPPFMDLHEVYRDQEEALVVKRIKKLKNAEDAKPHVRSLAEAWDAFDAAAKGVGAKRTKRTSGGASSDPRQARLIGE